jgi:MobA/VirD2-like, nuclease domain
VIAKISDPRGERVAGLIFYLFGPGRREEHIDPRLIAGWRHPAELEPPLRPDGGRDFRELCGLLQQPNAALGPRGFDRPVWHCAVRAAPQDRMLSDDEWAQIAAGVMHRTGLAPYGQDDDAVRWVAVRHGSNHIHIVAMLARQDGGRPRLSNERYRAREACRAAEERYGLRRTAPGDRTAARRPSRAENEKARRRGQQETPRVTLKRAVSNAAAGASSEREFFARLDGAGVLVRKRLSTRNPAEITGYAVALPGDTAGDGGPAWFGGGKLAADLTLPKLRRRWEPARVTPEEKVTAQERNALWELAAQTAADASAQIRSYAATSPAAAADAAWAAADTMHVVAAALDSRILRQAADSYDRAARVPYGRIPGPTPAGNRLRRAARLLAASAVGSDNTLALVTLVTRLAVLAEAVAQLRDVQQRAAQATSARRAVVRLHAARAAYATWPPTSRARARTPGDRIHLDFPAPPGALHEDPAVPAPRTPAWPSPRASPSPTSRRRRGPSR